MGSVLAAVVQVTVLTGCVGSTPVAEQERFQSALNKPSKVAAAEQWRNTVAGLRSATLSGEPGTMHYEKESIMEASAILNIMKLPKEH